MWKWESRRSSLSWEGRSGGKPFSGDGWGLGDYGITSQVQEIGEQDGLVAFSTGAAQPDGVAEDVVLGTTLLANRPFAAHAAFVDGVRHQGPASAELSTQSRLVDGRGLDVAPSERMLAAGC
jgi:hypothetical protein